MAVDRDHPADPSDADLLAAHVDGDPDAFGVLFARHRDRLWAVALRTTGHPETAADGLQDGLVAAYRRAGSFRGDARVTTWLHRVVVNACLDRLRSERVRATSTLPEETEAATYADRAGRAGDDTADPADRVAAEERRARVLAALAELPVDQRAALVLVDMEGYSVAEVAEILECAPGTVKSRCARGRARLVERLRPLVTEETSAPEDRTRNRPDTPDVGSVSERGPPEGPTN
ncbi:RNA polymerase sigma factor SigM [Nocardioides panacisoli]|uniref:RNA polymerase sigma factor SigM n=1 Tax=Nocardioides panacisoli TaxID=627624 RepID=UPI001C627CDA|nr:RNA polymerase sigma factor SigM [Nocardioides panacisoli]QYJ03294.1 RNA polymerase sigma factor SigM [Nocardioides panacisoli]